MKKSKQRNSKRTLLVVAIMIMIALLHLVTGTDYEGPFPTFVNGYLIDLVLPFGLYFLLCLTDSIIFDSWFVKGSLIFLAAFLVEMAQYRDIPLFGRTFDPFDIVMYGLGVLLAILFDQFLFPRLFRFWKPKRNNDPWGVESEEGAFTWHKN